MAERFEARGVCPGGSGLPKRFEEKAVQFEWLTALEVNQGRGFVSAHSTGAFDLMVGKGVGDVEAEGTSGRDNFEREIADQTFPA